MPYLVDSDILIDLLAERPDALAVLTQLAPEGLAMSMITYLEVYEGTLRTPQPREAQARLRTLLKEIPVLPLSFSLAERCAHLRDRLRREGKRVRSRAFDVLVAATALEHNLTLVTRNTEDYADIPELKLHTPQRRILMISFQYNLLMRTRYALGGCVLSQAIISGLSMSK